MATKKQRKPKAKNVNNHKIIYTLAVIVISLALGLVLKSLKTSKLSINEVAPPVATESAPFGLMLGNTPYDEITVAKSLGAKYYRSGITLTKITDPTYNNPENIAKIVNSGLKSVLTLSYDGGRSDGVKTISGPADISILKANLAQAIDRIHPAIVVYENEEDSYNKNFFSGTNAEYLAGLKAVCEVAHAKSIFCANGGITSASAIFLTANYYEQIAPDAGKYATLTTNTLGPAYTDMFNKYRKTMKSMPFQNRINKAKELVTAYKANGADLINFHWYNAGPEALSLVIDYFSQISGLPVMSNEIGVMSNATPESLTALMSVVRTKHLPIAIFYSFDDTRWNTKSIVSPDGTIRPEGVAYQQFINSNY